MLMPSFCFKFSSTVNETILKSGYQGFGSFHSESIEELIKHEISTNSQNKKTTFLLPQFANTPFNYTHLLKSTSSKLS